MRKRVVFDSYGRVCGWGKSHKINWKTLAIKVNSRMEEDLYSDIKFSSIAKVCRILLPKVEKLFDDEIEQFITDVIEELEENKEYY